MGEPDDGPRAGRGLVRAPQSLVAGLAMIALGLFGVWAASDLPQGTLRAIEPGLMPHWLAIGVAFCGVLLTVAGFTHDGAPLQSFPIRGPVFVLLAIFAFALTIRPVAIGGLTTTPGLGLIVAGPLAVIIGGYATPEARFWDLVALAMLLTAGCMLLFGDLLNLPIPIFPTAVIEALTGSISSRMMLRIAAGLLILFGVAIVLVLRRSTKSERIDVAHHSMST